MRKKIVLISGAVLVALVVGIVLLVSHSPKKPATQTNSPSTSTTGEKSSSTSNDSSGSASSSTGLASTLETTDIETTLETQSSDPTLRSGNFALISQEQVVSGWYIITVAPEGGASENEKLVLKQSGTSLTIISGPGTAFSSSSLTSSGVPQPVQDKLTVYDD